MIVGGRLRCLAGYFRPRRSLERYWREELDIEDESALHSLLAEIGASVDGFAAFVHEQGRAELDRLQSESISAGIFEVPTYLLNVDKYVGRQHLPLIRALFIRMGWQVDGRSRTLTGRFYISAFTDS